MINYNINFKKYKKYCLGNKITLPTWYNENRFNTVLHFLKDGAKLQAVKFLYELNKEHSTGLGLKECKDFVDIFERYIIVDTNQTPQPKFNVGELREALLPFIKIERLARLDKKYSHYPSSTIVFAYQGNYITEIDLARLEQIFQKIK